MNEAKKKELPLPIFAMVTRENISWKFSDLVDHLKKEHEFVQKKLKEKKEGGRTDWTNNLHPPQHQEDRLHEAGLIMSHPIY